MYLTRTRVILILSTALASVHFAVSLYRTAMVDVLFCMSREKMFYYCNRGYNTMCWTFSVEKCISLVPYHHISSTLRVVSPFVDVELNYWKNSVDFALQSNTILIIASVQKTSIYIFKIVPALRKFANWAWSWRSLDFSAIIWPEEPT